MDRVEKNTPESSVTPTLPVSSFVSMIKNTCNSSFAKAAEMEMTRMMPAIDDADRIGKDNPSSSAT